MPIFSTSKLLFPNLKYFYVNFTGKHEVTCESKKKRNFCEQKLGLLII